MTGFRIGQPHLKGHLFKMELVNRPECESCKQTSETASHVLWDCEVLATLRFRNLGLFQHDTAFCSKCGTAGCKNVMAAQRIKRGRSTSVTNMPALHVFYYISRIFCGQLHVVKQITCPRGSKYYFSMCTSYTIKLTWNSLRYLKWTVMLMKSPVCAELRPLYEDTSLLLLSI
jgi:hypothetical protein